MSLQCPKWMQLRGSDLAQGRWDESPYWHTGTCPYFWLDPFILAGLLLLVAGSTQKESQEEINAEFAERKEEDDERAETGKPQSLQFFIFGRQYGLRVGKTHSAPSFKHLPFGQALDLRSHTTSVWPLNLLRFFLCFTFFARRNAAGYRQHPPRSAVPTPFSPGLEKWNWAFLGMATPEKETVTTAENLSVLSLCWLFFLAPVQQIKMSLQSEMLNKQKKSANGHGKNIQTGTRMQREFSSLG